MVQGCVCVGGGVAGAREEHAVWWVERCQGCGGVEDGWGGGSTTVRP